MLGSEFKRTSLGDDIHSGRPKPAPLTKFAQLRQILLDNRQIEVKYITEIMYVQKKRGVTFNRDLDMRN